MGEDPADGSAGDSGDGDPHPDAQQDTDQKHAASVGRSGGSGNCPSVLAPSGRLWPALGSISELRLHPPQRRSGDPRGQAAAVHLTNACQENVLVDDAETTRMARTVVGESPSGPSPGTRLT